VCRGVTRLTNVLAAPELKNVSVLVQRNRYARTRCAEVAVCRERRVSFAIAELNSPIANRAWDLCTLIAAGWLQLRSHEQ